MKINHRSIVTVFLLTTFFSFSQSVQVQNGAQFLMEKRGENILSVLNTDPQNFSFITQRKKTYKLMTLDKDMKLSTNKQLTLPEIKGKEVKYLSSQTIGTTSYFFSRYFNKKSDEFTLYASDLNLKTGKFNKHIEVLKVKDNKFNFLSQPFQIIRSIDSTKVAFIIAYPIKGKEKAKYGIVVTDNAMNEIWKKDVVFNQQDKDFTATDFLVDKDGNVHIVATVRMDRSEKKEKGAKSRFYKSIYSYFHEEGELKEYEVGFKDEIIINANMQLNENNDLVCTGFYGEKKVFDAGMKGFFFLRIDTKTKEVAAKSLSPFDKKFLGQLMNERRAEKGKGLVSYVVRKTYTNSKGEMTVVSEYYYHEIIYDANGNYRGEIWSYGNVLVFFLDDKGEMKTYSILKKNQLARTSGSLTGQLMAGAGISLYPGANEVPYYGIGSMMKDDKLYLIYNENPKNEARLKSGKNPRSVRQRTSVTMLMIFSADGDITSNTLFKSVDKEGGYSTPVMPRYHYNYSNNNMLVIGRKGKKARLMNLTIE